MPHRLASRLLTGLVALTLGLGLTGAVPASAQRAADPRPGAAGIGDAYFPLDGNGGYDALHYDVRNRYHFDSGLLAGRTVMRAKATADLSRFNLDFLLPVSRVRVNGRAAAFRLVAGHELRITPRTPVLTGQRFVVEVRYAGRPARKTYVEKGWSASSREVRAISEPHGAPYWFPSNDHPTDKAAMDVTVVVSRGRQAISNGRLVSRTNVGPQWQAWHWRAREPMATYLAFFVAGDFVIDRGRRRGVPYVNAVSKQLTARERRGSLRNLRITPRVIAAYSRKLGPYPFSVTGGVVSALPSRVYSAVEAQTRSVFVGTPYRGTVAHETAHQWLGDDVSVERWSDIWLNEGFATFMSVWYSESRGGATTRRFLHSTYAAFGADDGLWDTRIGSPGRRRLFTGAVYTRGAMTLAALRVRLGEDTFWRLMRTWVSTHRGGNASVADFEHLAADVSGQDLDGFFDAWLHSTRKPARTAGNGL